MNGIGQPPGLHPSWDAMEDDSADGLSHGLPRRVRPRDDNALSGDNTQHDEMVSLLREQVMLLQLQISMQQNGVLQHYKSPDDVLNDVDPDFKILLKEWLNYARTQLTHLATQQDLEGKYKKIVDKGEVMSQFLQESKRAWQWPKPYLNAARRLEVVGIAGDAHSGHVSATAAAQTSATPMAAGLSVAGDASKEYSVEAEWKAMRKRHALECQAFVLAHQKACASFFEEMCSKKKLLLKH